MKWGKENKGCPKYLYHPIEWKICHRKVGKYYIAVSGGLVSFRLKLLIFVFKQERISVLLRPPFHIQQLIMSNLLEISL